MAGPIDVEKLPSGAVQLLIDVRVEIVALGLQKIRRQAIGGVAIKVSVSSTAKRKRKSKVLGLNWLLHIHTTKNLH